MSTMFRKAKIVGEVFKTGATNQLEDGWTWGIATYLGLHQGLKYKGSLRTGLVTTVVCLTGISAANGIRTVVKDWQFIKSQF